MPFPRFRLRTLMIAVAVVAGWLVLLRSPQFVEAFLLTVVSVVFAETVLKQTESRSMLLWICAAGMIALVFEERGRLVVGTAEVAPCRR